MESAIQLSEIERLAAAEAPDLAEAIISLLEAGDPSPDNVPEGALQFWQVLNTLRQARQKYRDEAERKVKVLEAWNRFLKQTDPAQPPRFGLAELIVRLYEEGSDSGRATVIELAKKAPLKYGLWAGLKRVYKLSESRLDPEVWGVLAWRFDTSYTQSSGAEVGKGTLLYLRRRVWRFLRNLGQTSPALYPQFAVQALRHYEEYRPSLSSTWVPNHVFFHQTHRYDANGFQLYGIDQNDLLKFRAFDESWKRAAAPLMYLLETAQADVAAKFAIQSLRKDFPEELRKVSAAWLARLSHRPLASAHDFLVETLQASPEYHQGKLKAAGLHDAVLQLLKSPSDKARTYAIEYARGHAQDLDSARLLELADSGYDDTTEFAVKAIQGRPAKSIGYELLGKALAVDALNEWATKALNESFDRNEIPEAFRLEMIFSSGNQQSWVVDWFKAKFQPGEVPVEFWKKVLEDKRSEDEYDAGELATEMLGQIAAAQIGSAWMLDHLDHGYWGDTIGEWLSEAESLPDLDVERVKGLVFHRSHRALALQILGNLKLVKPRDLGLAWLLALARREDATLHDFAHRYLLEHMEPADFADEQSKGIDRLFGLACGKKEPEPVRVFAQTYLRCHHPVIGPDQAESKQFSLTPKVPRDAYTADRVWPSLFDGRPDVRKFAVAVSRADLRRWGYETKVYDLAESEHKEVRNIAYDALLKAGEPNADESCTLTPEELDSDRIFGMTESRFRSTREVAMDLIRRHYTRLGGPERLAWLMQSNDRTVRMLAVRLLWERHRPRSTPDGWTPRVPTLGSAGSAPAPGGAGPAPVAPAPSPAAAAAQEDDEESADEDAELEDASSAEGDDGDDEGDEDEELDEDEDLDDEDDEDLDDEDDGDDESLDDEDDEDEDLDDDEDDDEEEEAADTSSGGTDRDKFRSELLVLVDELELSVRTANGLQNLGVTYLGELVQFTEIDLLKSKDFTRKSLAELKEILADRGFALGLKHEPWWPEQIKAKDAVPRELLEPEFDDGEEEEDEEDDEATVLEAEAGPTAGKILGGKAELYELLGDAVEAIFESSEAGLSDEASDAVQFGDAVYLGDLVQISPEEIADEYGRAAQEEIDAILRPRGLKLGMKWESWWPEVVDKRITAADDEITQPDRDAGMDEHEDEDGDSENGEVEDTVPSVGAGEKRESAPPPGDAGPGSHDSGPFRDVEALRDFLRRILYGLPPGRSMEPKDDVNVRRHLPANVAKRNAIEVVRDLAIEDVEFAKLVIPVLSEFTGSIAKGEWQACLTAMVQIANQHPGLDVPGLHVKAGKV